MIDALLKPATRETLRVAVFRRFLICVSIANIGQFLQGLMVPFVVNELTDSNAWVGFAGFMGLIPMVFATPVSGLLSDRMDRRTILRIAFGVQGLISFVLFLLYQADALTPWRLVGLSFLQGLTAGFQFAPIQSMSPSLVPERLLIEAVRLVSISFTIGRALGPAIAGVVFLFFEPGPAFLGTSFAYGLSLILLAGVKSGWVAPGGEPPSFWSEFRAGLSYMRQRPGMRISVIFAGSVALFGAVFTFALAASIADDAYGQPDVGLGALATAVGVGSLVSSVYISGAGGSVPRSTMERRVVLMYAGGILVAAATPYLIVGLVGFFVVGIAHMLHGVTLSTALQVQTEEEYRGRVMSVWLMSMLAAMPVGAIVAGVLADQFNIRAVMAGFATCLILLLVVISIRHDNLRPLDNDLATALDGGRA